MMRTTWLVQVRVEPDSTSPAAIRRACSALRLPFHEVSIVSGAASLPELPPIAGPVVFHGRTTLILRAHEHPTWRRGVFFDPLRFRHEAYVDGFGADVLNADAEVRSWEDFLREPHGDDEQFFVKPEDDLKQFSGGVLRFAECADLFRRLGRPGGALGPTSRVVIAKPREIDAEWRLFVVDGAVVTGSMYRPSGEAHVPPEAMAFAERAAARWVPSSVFVMDVARLERTWKIIECSCFNGSRFYAADVERLVRAVSQHQERGD